MKLRSSSKPESKPPTISPDQEDTACKRPRAIKKRQPQTSTRDKVTTSPRDWFTTTARLRSSTLSSTPRDVSSRPSSATSAICGSKTTVTKVSAQKHLCGNNCVIHSHRQQSDPKLSIPSYFQHITAAYLAHLDISELSTDEETESEIMSYPL
jgi:hypothetical protein